METKTNKKEAGEGYHVGRIDAISHSSRVAQSYLNSLDTYGELFRITTSANLIHLLESDVYWIALLAGTKLLRTLYGVQGWIYLRGEGPETKLCTRKEKYRRSKWIGQGGSQGEFCTFFVPRPLASP